MLEERPHRPPLTRDKASRAMRDHVRGGRLDGDVVEVALAIVGNRTPGRRTWPAGLTAREVEVLRLLALGLTNRAIAERLTISRKTVGAHVEHIYAKTGANNRATVGLFAMQHNLGREE
ncbi:MAG: LuxR C-terminal-related transcriptional regulator, partial [Nocardioidaceae bacterium]